MMRRMRFSVCVALLITAAGGCVHQAPTVAHIHVGHAITAARDTPGRLGYFTLAEQDARDALEEADAALQEGASLQEVKARVARVDAITNSEGQYPLTAAVREAAEHIRFAAFSEDSSENIRQGYEQFAATTESLLVRGELIHNYALEVAAADGVAQARELAGEVRRLAYANVHGEDIDGNGSIEQSEYGISQIGDELDALIDREDPPYVTVDRWYLFNLIRLPSGEWIFRRSGSKSSGGYQ